MTIKLLDKIKHSGIIYLLIFFIVSCGQHKKDFKCETSFLDIGNKQLQVFTGGEGDNTIVFESGLGVDGSTWLESGIVCFPFFRTIQK